MMPLEMKRSRPRPSSPTATALNKSRVSTTTTDTDTSGSERSLRTPPRAVPWPSAADNTAVDDDGDSDDQDQHQDQENELSRTLAALRVTPSASAADDAAHTASPRRPEPKTSQSTTRDMIERMRDAVLAASTHSTSSVRREAERAFRGDPRKHLRDVRALALPPHVTPSPRNVALFQCKKVRTATTRVLALAQLRAPIHEVVAVLTHRSVLSTPLLNPGLAAYDTLHTLIDEPTQYVAVKSLAMHRAWLAPHVAHAREFIVLESQRAFTTDDGRRGWVVTYHSLAWPGCPPPPRGAVRGSVYNTGIVALERVRKAECIDLYSVAEFKLKGDDASTRADWTAATERVLDTLALLTGTIEQRAMGELELLETSAFASIERHTELGECSLCAEKTKAARDPHDVGSGTTKQTTTYRCRKCCVSVCGACSSTWRRGTKELRLCLDCWGDATVEF